MLKWLKLEQWHPNWNLKEQIKTTGIETELKLATENTMRMGNDFTM